MGNCSGKKDLVVVEPTTTTEAGTAKGDEKALDKIPLDEVQTGDISKVAELVGQTPEVDGLSEKTKRLVLTSWDKFTNSLIGDKQYNALIIFTVLFKEAPETRELFSFVDDTSLEAMSENEAMIKHANRVINALSTVVNSIDDLDAVRLTMDSLGVRHHKYGAKEEHIQHVANGVLKSMETTLGDDFSEDYKKAWTCVLGMCGKCMATGINKARRGSTTV